MTRTATLVAVLGLIVANPAGAQDAPARRAPLGRIFLDRGPEPFSMVKKLAEEQAAPQWQMDRGPLYKSTPVVNANPNRVVDQVIFEGVFSPRSNTSKLAIFSDDGCDVWIEGKQVLFNYRKGQHLPDTMQSLHPLKVEFAAGKKYAIRIRYGNTIFGGPKDIDGCTLFAYDGGGSTRAINNDNKGEDPEIISITATVPSTPPRTARKADGTVAKAGDKVANNWPEPVDLKFISTTAITEADKKLSFPADMFEVSPAQPAPAVVLYKGGLSVKISVETRNLGGRSVSFDIIRAPDDADAIRNMRLAKPTFAPKNATEATLNTNSQGSFQFVAFFDKNGDGKWNSTEKGRTLPYILVQAMATTDEDKSSAGNKENLKCDFAPPGLPTYIRSHAGEFGRGEAKAGWKITSDGIAWKAEDPKKTITLTKFSHNSAFESSYLVEIRPPNALLSGAFWAH